MNPREQIPSQGLRRRAEHRGILLACALNAGVLAGSRLFGADASETCFAFLAVLQLAYLAPLAGAVALVRPASGWAKGVVIGAAISAIVSAGYCCKGESKPAPAPAPASKPVSRPAPPMTMTDGTRPAAVAQNR